MVILRALLRDNRAASAVEFAMVLPLLTLLLFSVIDAGRFMWEYNRAEKATQAGARMAVVTNVVEQGLVGINYVGGTLTQGDRIPASALGTVRCTGTTTSATCTCVTGTCPATATPCTVCTSAFTAIVTRMQYMSPSIKPTNVVVEYRGSGLGFAGDPDPAKPQISPLVTVKLTGMTFRPLAFLTFAAFTMPDFATTLTAEDLSGTASN
jgi:Flp pilus assembly protein TadG